MRSLGGFNPICTSSLCLSLSLSLTLPSLSVITMSPAFCLSSCSPITANEESQWQCLPARPSERIQWINNEILTQTKGCECGGVPLVWDNEKPLADSHKCVCLCMLCVCFLYVRGGRSFQIVYPSNWARGKCLLGCNEIFHSNTANDHRVRSESVMTSHHLKVQNVTILV